MEFFCSEKISKYVTCITSCTDENMFLIQGNKKAILVDTGSGIGDLKEYVDGIVRQPYMVICTHGHVDHAGGADQFEEVYLNHKDWDLASKSCTVEEKKKYAFCKMGDTAKNILDNDYHAERKTAYRDIREGYSIELGGLTVEMIQIPGHTAGMTGMLLKEERMLLVGDACNQRTFLFFEESLTIQEYLKSLQDLQRIEKKYDGIYLSHGNPIGPKDLIEDCKECCESILNGQADDEVSEFEGIPYYLAKKTHNFFREDGKLGNIAYSKTKIR